MSDPDKTKQLHEMFEKADAEMLRRWDRSINDGSGSATFDDRSDGSTPTSERTTADE